LRARDRRAEIERLLSVEREVSVDEMARLLDVTASTIRRDLAQLTAQGLITRTYGGALGSTGRPAEPPLHQRAEESRAEKDAIARWAAAEIQDGETVILDAGTTVGRVAHHLRGRSGITVVTNGLTAVVELADADGIEVIVLGGVMRHISQGFVGPLSELTLTRLSADRAFLGADGLVADRGICEASTVQTRLKELMTARSRRTYVLADNRKIGHAPFNAWAPMPLPWTLVTDDAVTGEQLAPFRRQPHIDVIVVPAAALAPSPASNGRPVPG
jgi:DeoR/GlpR family transcriptional regulator of sugar metabolism